MSSPRGPRGDESRAAMAGCQIVPKPRRGAGEVVSTLRIIGPDHFWRVLTLQNAGVWTRTKPSPN